MFRWRTCDDVIIYITNMLRRTFVPSILGNLALVIITFKKNIFGMYILRKIYFAVLTMQGWETGSYSFPTVSIHTVCHKVYT